MAYRYIVLLDAPTHTRSADDATDDTRFARLGLNTCIRLGRSAIHLSADTPFCQLADGSVVVGHLFARTGVTLSDVLDDGTCGSSKALRSAVLERCWGDYLLLQREEVTGRLSTFRDPSGGVPCVYRADDGSTFITSDISLAITLGLYTRQVDWDFIAHCLSFPTHKATRSGLEGISELPPGCTLTLDGARSSMTSDWNPWRFVAHDARYDDHAEAARTVREAVSSTVNTWIDIDRSTLVELSGGLDSSIVAISLQGRDSRVALCSLKTPIAGTDERIYAQQVADQLQLPLDVLDLGVENVTVDPVPPPSSVAPRMGVLQHAVSDVLAAAGERHQVNSHLSGAGGDTVFCYLSSGSPAADALRARGLVAWAKAVNDLATLHNCTFWRAGGLSLKKLRSSRAPLLRPDLTFVNSLHVAHTPERHPWFDIPPGVLPGDRERVIGLAGTQIFRDITPRSGGRPVRMPLLSQPVMEAALKTPTWMWFAGGRNRAVARDAFADVLPARVLERRSKGTFAGYLGAIYQRKRNEIRTLLMSGHLRERQLLDAGALERVLSEQTPPKDQQYLRILSLCMVESWIRHQN